ncbi:MAG: hypothetical protein KIS85_02675 [Anaerolineales bacterium]|nr:hypothetical protein [Anaerolineales bacterium]
MSIEQQGNTLRISVETSPAALVATPGLPPALAEAAGGEPAETLAAALLSGGPLACALLALDSQLELAAGGELGYGDLLALGSAGGDIRAVQFSTQPALGFAADPGGLCLALARWPGGRARLAVGGFAAAPALALDGREASGLAEALENALSAAPERLPAALALLAAIA